MTTLRPYQQQTVDRFYQTVDRGVRRVLLVAPTGAGKTVLAGSIVERSVRDGKRVLFVAHRRELIFQASQKLHAIGVDHGIIMAEHPTRPDMPVQVGSLQTFHARAIRSSRIRPPPADVVFIDEAHHAPAETYRQILDAYPQAVVVGLTATPCRGDGRGLGNLFDSLIESASVAELINLGFLVPTKVYAPATPDLDGVHTRRGDYVESELADRMDRPKLVGDLVSHWHRFADHRQTVVFATSVAHSMHIRDEFRASGILTEHIDGATPPAQRDSILAAFARGDFNVLTNCFVLTEGWDCPAAGCLVLARPTKQIGLFRQMAGRVLRPAPGKTDAIILDHAGAVYTHGFVEDDVEWTLDVDDHVRNVEHERRTGAQSGNRLTTCPRCSHVRVGGQACPACGWKPEQGAKAVHFGEGELGEVDRDRRSRALTYTAAERERWHSGFAWIAKERGYAAGWVAHKYREKFGTWPAHRHVTASPPSGEMLAYIRSRNIAYARARKAGEAA